MTGGNLRTLSVTPKTTSDKDFYHSFWMEVAAGIEPAYRALQALARHRESPGQTVYLAGARRGLGVSEA